MQKLFALAVSACLVALLGGAPAHAAFATFVSGNGNDSADCLTPATACRQINAAIGKTDAGGTVAVLPGDYDAFTIGLGGKQVDVIAQDGIAMVASQLLSVPGGGEAAILVNVDASGNMPIRIHGLTIAAGGGGIVILGNAPEVDIRNCSFSGLGPNYAIDFRPSQTGELFINDTVISRAVGSGSGGGIRIAPTAGADAKVLLDGARLLNNVHGMIVDGRNTTGVNTVTVRNSTFAGNGVQWGLHAIDGGGGTTNVSIEGSSFSGNTAQGVVANGANVTVRMRDSSVTGNGRGVQAASSSKIISHGGNVVAGNTINGAFTQTLPQQ